MSEPRQTLDDDVFARLAQSGVVSNRTARRIVVAYNACAGIPNERLEQENDLMEICGHMHDEHAELATLRTQVADLRAALEGLMADESNECDCPPEENCPNEMARRVLAATQPQEVQS